MGNRYEQLSAGEIVNSIQSGELSARGTAERALALADTVGRDLNAVISLCPDRAIDRAEKIDRQVKENTKTGILSGVPVLLKDNIVLAGYPTTCGSKMLQEFVSPYDATCVRKLDEAGAIIIGKANMDEFAMGSSNETSFFGSVKNPLNDSVVPGGSSGGAAAAVAAGIVPLAIGSDTGGSVRQPAGFCGLAGMKPTYGTVSRYGLVSFASSLDQIGPITRDVRDCRIAFEAIAGHDERDSTSIGEVPQNPDIPLEQLKIGVIKDPDWADSDPEVTQAFIDCIVSIKDSGYQVVDLDMPHLQFATACYYIIATAEASANLARYDGIRFGHSGDEFASIQDLYEQNRSEGFGTEVKRRIMLGTYVLSAGYYDAYYEKACHVRRQIIYDFDKAFAAVDLIITPTSPTTAFEVGSRIDSPLDMYRSDVFTIPASLAGLPAISIPMGNDSQDLPLGLQIIGPHAKDSSVFRAASGLAGLFKGV
jgi:aspartyl-tRNA(Asn)/glutamyl-tRNA(Gln) amidotransferase subunit A